MQQMGLFDQFQSIGAFDRKTGTAYWMALDENGEIFFTPRAEKAAKIDSERLMRFFTKFIYQKVAEQPFPGLTALDVFKVDEDLPYHTGAKSE